MKIKYPRTPHLPWSPGATNDDVRLSWADWGAWENRHVVITTKMDGENTTMYRDGIHARSLDSRHHPSRDWVKGLWGRVREDIPIGWRLCGENLFAQHSITYDRLPSYFLIFSIWNSHNMCLSWHETKEWANLLGLELVPALWEGVLTPANRELVMEFTEDRFRMFGNESEGYVLRDARRFPFDQFGSRVAKYVRKGHVTTDEHWMHREVVPNVLR